MLEQPQSVCSTRQAGTDVMRTALLPGSSWAVRCTILEQPEETRGKNETIYWEASCVGYRKVEWKGVLVRLSEGSMSVGRETLGKMRNTSIHADIMKSQHVVVISHQWVFNSLDLHNLFS